MPEPLPADAYADLVAAIAESDAAAIRRILLGGEFILISVEIEDDDEDDDDEAIGALTADMDDQQVLVVFSSEEHAGLFVGATTDMFSDGEEVQGFLVDGETVLEYLPEGYGLLLNPETDDTQIITAPLAEDVLAAGSS